MPNYTILVQSGRSRLIRNDNSGTSSVVTTVTDPQQAVAIAAVLTEAVTDIPHAAVCYVLDRLDLWHLGVSDLSQSETTDRDWSELTAPTTGFSLRRRALNAFDVGEAAHTDPVTGVTRNRLHSVLSLRETIEDQPESVVRAVRDELANAYAAYDGTPVLARAYDRKWGDCDELFLANAGLALLDDATLDGLAKQPDLYGTSVLNALGGAGLADFSYADQVDMAGYLTVDLNTAQLASWLQARTR